MKRLSRSRERGLTVVEVAIGATLTVLMIGLGGRLSLSSMRDSNGMYVRTSLSTRSAEATNQIVNELQLATIYGEDANGNHVLDNGEDINRNGHLDSDWNLVDGGTASALTFNTAQDGWLWSGPISYSVANGVLLRTQGSNVRQLCRGVTSFQLTRTGHVVDVLLTVSGKDRSGATWTETSSRRADVRNQ